MISTDNYIRGERRSKLYGKGLTDSDIRDIRAAPASLREIAEAYGISDAMVCYIKQRKKWRHVKDLMED